jgi:hypothetical protein
MTTGLVSAISLNIRQTPDPNGSVVAILVEGDPVDTITPDESGTWLLISAEIDNVTQIGWVQSQYITPAGATNPKYPGSYFTALVYGGYFSSDPDTYDKNNPNTLRAIRTNNAGAINDLDWQHSRPGYVCKTVPDSAGNKTAIYSSPEYGVASWYTLLADRYNFARTGGAFTITQLAQKYAGADAGQAAINSYIDGWCKLADTPFDPQSTIHLLDDDEMLNLARGMFRHESSGIVRITGDQILFGIRKQRVNQLPPPPKPP